MVSKNNPSKIYPEYELSLTEAKKYWSDQLQNQTIINVPQDKDCQISVVIPVHNEDLTVILRQLQSIIAQKNISPNHFEVIYIVNNSLDANSEVVKKNTEILNIPIWRNRKNVMSDKDYPNEIRGLLGELRKFSFFVIDKSSPGNEIPDCNVGKARNRAIAEASSRFSTNDKDGLIFQIDADSYYPDTTYFRRVIDVFSENLKLIALCGGVRLYCDAEKYTDKEKERSRPEVSLLCDYLRWKSLKFLLLGKSFVYDYDFMSGPNMISKSFPAAVVHGVPDVKRAEDDVLFGERLQLYAKKYGLQYSFDGVKDSFRVDSLLRLSGGLTNNLGSNIKTDDSGLMYTYDDSGKIIFNAYPYETAVIEPIPVLYKKFKRLALENDEAKYIETINRFEAKITDNERFLLRQLKY